jgi:hypothetical protein
VASVARRTGSCSPNKSTHPMPGDPDAAPPIAGSMTGDLYAVGDSNFPSAVLGLKDACRDHALSRVSDRSSSRAVGERVFRTRLRSIRFTGASWIRSGGGVDRGCRRSARRSW